MKKWGGRCNVAQKMKTRGNVRKEVDEEFEMEEM